VNKINWTPGFYLLHHKEYGLCVGVLELLDYADPTGVYLTRLTSEKHHVIFGSMCYDDVLETCTDATYISPFEQAHPRRKPGGTTNPKGHDHD
jgi:hypothetical protein